MATGMDPDFQSRLQALIAEVNARGGSLSVGSGYRSPERQAELFAAAVKKYGSERAARKWVAPPGRSNHNRGIAADLRGDLNLAHKLAPKFGLYFPMSHEPWHIEPRGSRGGDATPRSPQREGHTEPPDNAAAIQDGLFPDVEERKDPVFQLSVLLGMLDRGEAPQPVSVENPLEDGVSR